MLRPNLTWRGRVIILFLPLFKGGSGLSRVALLAVIAGIEHDAIARSYVLPFEEHSNAAISLRNRKLQGPSVLRPNFTWRGRVKILYLSPLKGVGDYQELHC